jgi:hypothetical protein
MRLNPFNKVGDDHSDKNYVTLRLTARKDLEEHGQGFERLQLPGRDGDLEPHVGRGIGGHRGHVYPDVVPDLAHVSRCADTPGPE